MLHMYINKLIRSLHQLFMKSKIYVLNFLFVVYLIQLKWFPLTQLIQLKYSTWFQLFGNKLQRLFMASSKLYTIKLN